MSGADLSGPAPLGLLAAASAAAAAVNAVAGGGTILTFPVLVAILPDGPGRAVAANATSTIGIWPGSLAAAWAYRGERATLPAWARWLLVPSVIGAAIGVLLVLQMPPRSFAAAVPWLILLAAVLFAAQPWLQRLVPTAVPDAPGGPSAAGVMIACAAQLLVAVYGGYFGAGIGILMLAVLGLAGLGDIHRLNGVKNVLATVINGVATGMFAAGSALGGHQVSWTCVAVMAAGSVVGGLAGAAVARRLPAATVRRGVAILGFALAAYYLWRSNLG
ncbi:MAG: sulfite exporter TauE/SafE family protein [Planctomycetaceae bacterium]